MNALQRWTPHLWRVASWMAIAAMFVLLPVMAYVSKGVVW